MLAQYAAWPLYLPFVAHLALVAGSTAVPSVSPAFLAVSLGIDNHAVSGLVVALASFSSTAGQLAVGRVGVGRSLPLGCAGLIAGLALLAGALRWDLMALVVASALVGGGGQRLAFRGALAAVAEAPPADRRAAVISTLFVVAYAGISVPGIGEDVSAPPEGERAAPAKAKQRQGGSLTRHPLLATLNV